MEMRCFRKILRVSYKDHVTNEAVRNKIKQAIGPYDDLLTTVKKRKLKWYGHVSRSSGLAKTILQGTVRGGDEEVDRRRGGKTTSKSGQEWSSLPPRGLSRTGKRGESWLESHQWCPNDPYGLWESEVKCGSMLIMGVTSILSPITRQSYEISPWKKIVIFQHFDFHFS